MLFSSALQQKCNIISIFILGFVNTLRVYPLSESGLSNAGLIHESTPHSFRIRFWTRKCHPESLIPQTLTLWNTLLRECFLNQYAILNSSILRPNFINSSYHDIDLGFFCMPVQ